MSEVEAVLLTGLAAVLVAIWGILSQRSIARRRATVDWIFKSMSDKDLIDAHSKFIQLAKGAGGLVPYAAEEREKEKDTQAILLILNLYELLSIGIQGGALDYAMFRKFARTTTMRHWARAEPFVDSLRARLGSKVLFHEFEELNQRLSDERPPKRNWWIGKFW